MFVWTMQTDRVGNVVELLVADVLQLLACRSELLVNLDDLFRHHFVCFLGAADQSEVRAGGEALVPVRIQADAEHHRPALLLSARIRHAPNLETLPGEVKRRRPALTSRANESAGMVAAGPSHRFTST